MMLFDLLSVLVKVKVYPIQFNPTICRFLWVTLGKPRPEAYHLRMVHSTCSTQKRSWSWDIGRAWLHCQYQYDSPVHSEVSSGQKHHPFRLLVDNQTRFAEQVEMYLVNSGHSSQCQFDASKLFKITDLIKAQIDHARIGRLHVEISVSMGVSPHHPLIHMFFSHTSSSGLSPWRYGKLHVDPGISQWTLKPRDRRCFWIYVNM